MYLEVHGSIHVPVSGWRLPPRPFLREKIKIKNQYGQFSLQNKGAICEGTYGVAIGRLKIIHIGNHRSFCIICVSNLQKFLADVRIPMGE